MKKIEVSIYKFNELEEKTKQKIIEKYLYSDNYNFVYEDNTLFFSEDVKSELSELGFYDVNFFYSLSYCQGDGCCFTGKIDPLELNVLFPNEKNLRLEIVKNSSRYCHYNTVDFYVYDDYGNYFDDDSFLHDIKYWYKNKMFEFEKRGYDILDHDNLKSYLADYLVENGIEFLFSGEEFKN